jgi:hypothetical protein
MEVKSEHGEAHTDEGPEERRHSQASGDETVLNPSVAGGSPWAVRYTPARRPCLSPQIAAEVTEPCSSSGKPSFRSFSNQIRLSVSVSHFPPGTSGWNKIEHRLFLFISQNWPGKSLVTHEVIVNSIASTTTSKELLVNCAMDYNKYPKGVKVTALELKKVNLTLNAFHGEWNYTITPANHDA